MCFEIFHFLEVDWNFCGIYCPVVRHLFFTVSSQDKIKKGQRKSAFCGHYCPKCRDDLKGDDPCANSSDCTICSSFSDEQKRKIMNRNRYKSKKNQNSAVFLDTGGKNGIDDSLLDEDESSASSQVPASQKSRSLEDKLDRFFSEFANLSQRIQNLEQKDSETAGSRTSSGRDCVYVARQPVGKAKAQPSSSASAGAPGRLERRSVTITRAEFEQQSTSGQFCDELFGFHPGKDLTLSHQRSRIRFGTG